MPGKCMSSLVIKKEFKELSKVVPDESTKHLFKSGHENKTKNRYANVLPFEETMVKLKNSEYINANYITPMHPKGKKVRFISTQAPTSNTFNAFYRMVWEHKVPVIVMLTKLLEGRQIKASCYWPALNTTEQFDEVCATTLYENIEDKIVFRKIRLTRGDKERTVCLLQYLGWPDKGVPKSSDGIIKLINIMDDERIANKISDMDHIVVHCSAGIGRTGTFLAIYTALNFLKDSKEVDVQEIVENLRKQRMLMVQASIQYEFIYKALEDYMNKENNLNLSIDPNALTLLTLSSSLEDLIV